MPGTSYMPNIASVVSGYTLALLCKWKGNFIKLIYKDAIIFMIFYAILSLIYRLILEGEQKKVFEEICIYCNQKVKNIPLGFILGFLIAHVLVRWWQIVESVPYFLNLAIILRLNISKGDPSRCFTYRKIILRHMNLAWILKMRLLSPKIWKRFIPRRHPKYHHYQIEDTLRTINGDPKVRKTLGGLINPYERDILIVTAKSKAEDTLSDFPKLFINIENPELMEYWLPIIWTQRVIERARKRGYLTTEQSHLEITTEIKSIQDKLEKLTLYDSFPIPLAYCQTVIIGIHVYFLAQLFAEQFLDPSSSKRHYGYDLYVPVFTLLEFMFFFSWFKVAICMLNPHGDDDDDLPLWKLLDDNLQISKDIALREENELTVNEFPGYEIKTDSKDISSPTLRATIDLCPRTATRKIQTVSQATVERAEQIPELTPDDLENEFELECECLEPSEEDKKMLDNLYQDKKSKYSFVGDSYVGNAIEIAKTKESKRLKFSEFFRGKKNERRPNEQSTFNQMVQHIHPTALYSLPPNRFEDWDNSGGRPISVSNSIIEEANDQYYNTPPQRRNLILNGHSGQRKPNQLYYTRIKSGVYDNVNEKQSDV